MREAASIYIVSMAIKLSVLKMMRQMLYKKSTQTIYIS